MSTVMASITLSFSLLTQINLNNRSWYSHYLVAKTFYGEELEFATGSMYIGAFETSSCTVVAKTPFPRAQRADDTCPFIQLFTYGLGSAIEEYTRLQVDMTPNWEGIRLSRRR